MTTGMTTAEYSESSQRRSAKPLAGLPSTAFRPERKKTTTSRNVTLEDDRRIPKGREDTMAHSLKQFALGVALICILGSVGHTQNAPRAPAAQNNPTQPTPAVAPSGVRGFVPVTDQTLRNPQPDD